MYICGSSGRARDTHKPDDGICIFFVFQGLPRGPEPEALGLSRGSVGEI